MEALTYRWAELVELIEQERSRLLDLREREGYPTELHFGTPIDEDEAAYCEAWLDLAELHLRCVQLWLQSRPKKAESAPAPENASGGASPKICAA